MIRPAYENFSHVNTSPALRKDCTMPDARENNPQAPIVNREQLKELVKQDLSQTERLILISYYITRMNEHEIASALDLTADKVQQSLEQMKAKIREMCCEYKTLKVA